MRGKRQIWLCFNPSCGPWWLRRLRELGFLGCWPQLESRFWSVSSVLRVGLAICHLYLQLLRVPRGFETNSVSQPFTTITTKKGKAPARESEVYCCCFLPLLRRLPSSWHLQARLTRRQTRRLPPMFEAVRRLSWVAERCAAPLALLLPRDQARSGHRIRFSRRCFPLALLFGTIETKRNETEKTRGSSLQLRFGRENVLPPLCFL